MTIKYSDIEMAFDMASFVNTGECEAWLNISTGETYVVSDYSEDEIPEDLYESDAYLQLPSKYQWH